MVFDQISLEIYLVKEDSFPKANGIVVHIMYERRQVIDYPHEYGHMFVFHS